MTIFLIVALAIVALIAIPIYGVIAVLVVRDVIDQRRARR